MTPLYLIETDHGPTGKAVDNFESRATVVREIAEGYHFAKTFTVSRVLEIRPDGTWSDITADVAREVRDRILAEPFPDYGWHMADWLHRKLGVNALQWPIEGKLQP